ncbi:uridine kinase [Oenococcus oeni]|uniref:uridine kinase n=2 Tax=Oenococcus oeni TaxID=1247 RepID=UPI0004ABF01F|nr:uridine kinase [Oenococcus oeni]KEP87382.1 uridine/cytidine kinase [Oenococcus oeni IOEB_0501]OIL20465.1 uridine kinase [Oenococcus oeni]OIL35504.1 uridine kinase [Oenococcus oeni]OIL41777.1 uridine kinase [Oenococcus oeni]OIM35555.1 uridine kinase [Oenococcus oeni]
MQNDKDQPIIIIGITGGSGSGKTSIARDIHNQLKKQSVAIIPQDAFYNDQTSMSIEQRKKINYDHPDSFDRDLFYNDLLKLKNRQKIQLPIYDYEKYTRSKKTILINPARVIIVEGVLLFVDQRIRNLLDIKIYVDADDDIRFIRRLKRDISERGRTTDSIINQYLKTMKPMYHQFVEPTKRYADVIIPEGESNQVGINLLINQIKTILN